MVNPFWSNSLRSPLSIGMASFTALLVGVAATAALDHLDAYRMRVISAAPCTKRALTFAPFESVLSWISLAGLGTALLLGVVTLALGRGSGQRSRVMGPALLVVVSAIMLALTVMSHSSPFDFDSSTLPMCGATGRLGDL